MSERTFWESVKVEGGQVIDKLKQVIREGNARRIVVKRGESPAALLLEELRLRLLMGRDVGECDRLLQQLRANHINEPGVAQALYQLLVEFGIISPDGRPAAKGRAAGETVAEAAAPPEPSKLWTPDAPAPASEKKSALWTPDMD